jgi:GxxExxY protein
MLSEPGFLESIYHHALLHELNLRGLSTQTQLKVDILYKAQSVGTHRLDIIVENSVIVELKAVNSINELDKAQTISYLAAAGLEVALIFNFGEQKLSWKRLIKSRQCRELRELI